MALAAFEGVDVGCIGCDLVVVAMVALSAFLLISGLYTCSPVSGVR